jgi:hypothetical protein
MEEKLLSSFTESLTSEVAIVSEEMESKVESKIIASLASLRSEMDEKVAFLFVLWTFVSGM